MKLSKALGLVVCFALFAATTARGELVINGDFQSGGIGFNSNYTATLFNNTGTGQLTVGTDPAAWASIETPFVNPDPPNSTNQMLIVNGSTNVFDRVWIQQINLPSAGTYTASFSAANLTAPSNKEANLQLYVVLDPNTPFSATYVSGLDLKNKATGAWYGSNLGPGTFTAANSGPVTLFLANLQTSAAGNNFAVDNISVVPEPSSLALLGLGSLVGLGVYTHRRRKQA